MGTRGHVTVVADEHHYSLYQHWDMYPHGWPADIFKEAAEIARDDQWDVVAHGWTNKAWVDWEDDKLPRELRETATHPDGRFVERGGWAHSMRPRLSVEQMEEKARKRGASESLIAGLGDDVESTPSLREAAAMEVMEKDLTLMDGNHDREFGVVVDMDCGEIVMLKHCGDWSGERIPVPIARAALDDPEAMIEIAEWASDSKGERFDGTEVPDSIRSHDNIGTWGPGDLEWVVVSHHEDERLGYHYSVGGPRCPSLRPLATYASRVEALLGSLPSPDSMQATACQATGREWPDAHGELQDGMWRRPPSFPPLKGTPRRFLGAANSIAAPRARDALTRGSGVGGSMRCDHIGVRSGTQCVRPQHSDKHHRYS